MLKIMSVCLVSFGGFACCLKSAFASDTIISRVDSSVMSKAHDYTKVDISTLSPEEITYVPEARKIPIIKKIIGSADWSLLRGFSPNGRSTYGSATNCMQLLDDLRKWQNVEILEPVIRANHYGDSAFKEWREVCPSKTTWIFQSYFTSGGHGVGISRPTHSLKVYQLPELHDFLVFSVGDGRAYSVNPDGNWIDKPYKLTTSRLNTGSFRSVDVSKCHITGLFDWSVGGAGYDYYWRSTALGKGYGESVIARIQGHPYLLGLEYLDPSEPIGHLFHSSLTIHDVVNPEIKNRDEDDPNDGVVYLRSCTFKGDNVLK